MTLFEKENKALVEKEANDKQREELYAEIGKLTTHVAWLKKIWPRPSAEMNAWRYWSGALRS